MCLAAVTSKKALNGKNKVFASLKGAIKSLRNQTAMKTAKGPDIFDLAKRAATTGKAKPGGKR